MASKRRMSIQVGALGGLALLLGVFATVVATLILALEAGHANHELLTQIRRVEVVGEGIQRRGLHYVRNAPRDYCPYDRDVIVFYPDFMADLDTYDRLIADAVTSAAGAGTALMGLEGLLGVPEDQLGGALAELSERWQTFRRELLEKLGDLDEPRLEWGTEYIRDHQAELDALVGKVTDTVTEAIEQRQRAVEDLARAAAIAALVLFFLGALWFYLRIVRRVVVTVDGCRRVAQGEFGYQVPVQGQDELGELADAVNRLSSRARLVLELLDNMQRSDSAPHKLAFLLGEAGSYLPTTWLGLWQRAPSGEVELVHMDAVRDWPEARAKGLAKTAERDATLTRLTNDGRVVRIDDIGAFVLSQPTARVLRELATTGVARSALVLPLSADNGWDGLLILAADQTGAFDQEQAALLGNLSTVLANGLSRALSIRDPARPL